MNDKIIIYNTTDGKAAVALYAQDGNIWMNQKQIAELFDTSKQNISLHIIKILEEGELSENSVVKDYLTTGPDNKGYNVTFYSLNMILAIGFRVRSKRGTQFRKWANKNLKEYVVKGFLLDSERLKNPDGRSNYFDELLAQIRDIRSSEKIFYQKVRDLLSLSSDYDCTDKRTQMFFAETQNKILYAITGKTAAEIIVQRANRKEKDMALTSWKGSVVRKQDIFISKNYLDHKELDKLNRFVTVFLETAELRVQDEQEITISFWRENIDKIIELNNKELLLGKGSVSKKEMEERVTKIYEYFDKERKGTESELANNHDFSELEKLENSVKENS